MDPTNNPARGRRGREPGVSGNPEPAGEPDGDPVPRKADAGDFWTRTALPDPAFSLKDLDSGSA